MPTAARGALLTCALASAWALALGGCAYRPGHPVLRGPWGWGPPRAPAPPAAPPLGEHDPTLVSLGPAERLDQFFADLPQLRLRLREMRARARAPGEAFVHHVDREAAAGILRRSGGRGLLGGALRNVCVYGASGHVPLAPEPLTTLWLDPVLQGRALGIQAFERERVVFALPEAARIDYRVALLDIGTPPLTFDLVFGTAIEGLRLADGSVALRYDLRATRGQRHVTFWRGGALFEPHPTGTWVAEVVIFGTDIVLPLLEPVLRGQVEQALEARAINLMGFAYQAAGLPVPRALR